MLPVATSFPPRGSGSGSQGPYLEPPPNLAPAAIAAKVT